MGRFHSESDNWKLNLVQPCLTGNREGFLSPRLARDLQFLSKRLSGLAEATSKFRRKSKGVILHVSPSVASKWLMPWLPKLTAENPGICISTEAKEVVLNRSFSLNEAAIRHAKSFQPVRGQDHRCLTELQLVAVCSPALKRQMGPVGVPELLEMPLIQDSHCRWDRLAGKLNTAPAQEIMSFNRTALAIDAAINLQGVAMVPKVLAEQDIRLGNLIVIWEDPEPSGEYLFLIWHKQLTRNTSIMKVVEWILSEFKIAPQ